MEKKCKGRFFHIKLRRQPLESDFKYQVFSYCGIAQDVSYTQDEYTQKLRHLEVLLVLKGSRLVCFVKVTEHHDQDRYRNAVFHICGIRSNSWTFTSEVVAHYTAELLENTKNFVLRILNYFQCVLQYTKKHLFVSQVLKYICWYSPQEC